MYKILVADDHPLFREAIHSVIASAYPDADILETDSLDEALVMVQSDEDLDLILLDLNMPGMNGLNGLISMRNEFPTIPVVIISAEDDKQIVLQAITCGAVGFISKSSPREHMTEALAHILKGNVYLPPDIIRQAQDPTKHRQRKMNSNPDIPSELLTSLTRRQLLVLQRMVTGESNKQIAYQLNIAETTVKAHVSAILSKLGVHNRVQAILAASDINFSNYLRK